MTSSRAIERLSVDMPASSLRKLDVIVDYYDMKRAAAVAFCIRQAFDALAKETDLTKLAADHGVPMPEYAAPKSQRASRVTTRGVPEPTEKQLAFWRKHGRHAELNEIDAEIDAMFPDDED